MNNTQLCILICIPSVLVLFSIALDQLGQARIETRLTVIEHLLRDVE